MSSIGIYKLLWLQWLRNNRYTTVHPLTSPQETGALDLQLEEGWCRRETSSLHRTVVTTGPFASRSDTLHLLAGRLRDLFREIAPLMLTWFPRAIRGTRTGAYARRGHIVYILFVAQNQNQAVIFFAYLHKLG